MPTDQELLEKEQQAFPEELSDIQFSAHITEEFTAQAAQDIPGTSPELSPEFTPEQPDPEDEIARRDREILVALDEMLQKNIAPAEAPHKKKRPDLRRLTIGTMKRGAGVLSLAVTLVMMGITLMCLLISGTQDLSLLIKLSPIAAVLLGVEIILSWLSSGRKIRLHIPCVCADAAIVIGCCILAAVLNSTITETEQVFSDRSAEAAIYDKTYPLLKHTADISKLTVDVDLNLEGGKKRTDDSLTTADDIRVSVELDGYYTSPSEFAAECGSIMKVFDDLDIPADEFSFRAETRLMSFALDIEGKYQQDYSVEKLTGLVRYVFIEDYDYIQDLADFTEETGEAAAED